MLPNSTSSFPTLLQYVLLVLRRRSGCSFAPPFPGGVDMSFLYVPDRSIRLRAFATLCFARRPLELERLFRRLAVDHGRNLCTGTPYKNAPSVTNAPPTLCTSTQPIVQEKFPDSHVRAHSGKGLYKILTANDYVFPSSTFSAFPVTAPGITRREQSTMMIQSIVWYQ